MNPFRAIATYFAQKTTDTIRSRRAARSRALWAECQRITDNGVGYSGVQGRPGNGRIWA